MADVLDKLRRLVEDQRETGHDIAATICEAVADHFEDLADKLTATEDERDALAARLQELERLLEGLSTICDLGRLACNLSEGDQVPRLEVRRG